MAATVAAAGVAVAETAGADTGMVDGGAGETEVDLPPEANVAALFKGLVVGIGFLAPDLISPFPATFAAVFPEIPAGFLINLWKAHHPAHAVPPTAVPIPNHLTKDTYVRFIYMGVMLSRYRLHAQWLTPLSSSSSE